jgi:hypothetical protein
VRGGDDLEEDEEVNSFNLFYTSKAHLVVNYVTSAPYISAPLRTGISSALSVEGEAVQRWQRASALCQGVSAEA